MVPKPAASQSPSSLLEMHILGPHPDLLGQKLGVGPAVCALMSPPGGYVVLLRGTLQSGSSALQMFLQF